MGKFYVLIVRSSGAVVHHANSKHRGCEFESLARKATGNHLIKSTP